MIHRALSARHWPWLPSLTLGALAVAFAPGLFTPAPVAAQTLAAAHAGDHPIHDTEFMAGFAWRNLGPDRGGRSIAVAGVVGQPNVAYFGATGGGLWKTEDHGENWFAITDFQVSSASVGAVAVSESLPELLFIGMGETCIRGNILPGDGVYRSRDAGDTWQHVGFNDSDGISKIRIHPTNPEVVFVASFGKYGAESEERGVYKSTDGGDTWRRVLFRDTRSGAIDISIDRNNPDVIYAALWEAYRKEYNMSSGGPGSGLFKSTDGGETWTEITRAPGLPQEGLIGRIGVAVSGADSNRVYALVENANGGLFRSDDAGATWELVNDNRAIRQRAFYYTHVFADHNDRDVVYMQNTSFFRSTDGGVSYEVINNGTHGDFHDLWVSPTDPAHLVVANDGGGAVSLTTGGAWTDQEFPTAQMYHAVTTAHEPFHVCGSQQDNSTLCVPSDYNSAEFGFGSSRGRGYGSTGSTSDPTAGSTMAAYRVGGGEPGYIAPDPKDPDIFYSGTNNGRYLDRFDRGLEKGREVNPYPWFYSGEPASDMVERWQWTFPIIFSPIDPNVLFTSSQRLWRTIDGGNNWQAISPDLTRADPSTLGTSGGPITGDMNGPEVYATIFAVGPGKLDLDVIWTGSDDGLVHVTRDGGASWTNITPSDMPDFGRVSQIDASAFSSGRAYVSVRRPLLDDQSPYIWKTDDYGQSWTKIINGLRDDAYVHAVREDPMREGLLYAATQHGVYVSFNDGAEWVELNPGLPDLPIVDLIVEEDELVITAHGRSFWILDNIAPLRQAEAGLTNEELVLFDPAPGYRSSDGINLSWWLNDTPSEARLEIVDGAGEVLRTYEPAVEGQARDRWQGPALPVEPGLNRINWDLRTKPAVTFPGMILWGVRTMSPSVPPGEYTVRLTADGQVAETTVEVRPHPWIDVAQDDLVAQFEFGKQIRAKVNEANEAVIAVRRMKVQVEERLASSDDAALRAAADRLVDAASAVEADIYQVRNRSNQDPLNFPIKVNNRLANLLSMVEAGDGRPVNGMYDVFDIMVEELQRHTDRLQQVWDSELAAANRELSRLGLEAIDPWDASTVIEAPPGVS
jgi:photosystem II stability/assembly factor-like uncharacterized protein